MEAARKRFFRGDDRHLPLYEGKMVHHYDHRWASFKGNGDEFENIAAGGAGGKESASIFAMPRRWAAAKGKVSARRGTRDVELAGVADRLAAQGWDREWVCGW